MEESALDGSGNGGGELGERALSWGCGFDPIKPAGKHKSGDHLDFALSGPRPAAKREAQLGGFGEALVDGGAA